jgi:hypothetical protein
VNSEPSIRRCSRRWKQSQTLPARRQFRLRLRDCCRKVKCPDLSGPGLFSTEVLLQALQLLRRDLGRLGVLFLILDLGVEATRFLRLGCFVESGQLQLR